MNPVPMWLPTAGGHAFAWYHPPAGGAARRGAILLCDPFGWHRMVLHQTYRRLALRLSGAGFPVMRVDYPGTCDAEGWPRDSARLETWLSSLESALDALKHCSGARRVALFGALLGGTFAVMLAARRSDVVSLALWGAYLQGSTALRTELAAAAVAPTAASMRTPPGAREGDREAFGFLLTAAMIEDLQRIDLLRVVPRGVRAALVLPRSGTSADARLGAHFSSAGIAADLRARAGEDLDAVLHSAGAGHPRGTIEQIGAWLEQEFPEREAIGARLAAPFPPHADMAVSGARIRETAVHFGADQCLFGILSEPQGLPVRGPAVVLVSAGRNHRPGINRNYTEWARKLAARGHRVLRVDLRGLGDSPRRRFGADVLYSAAGRRDVLDAVACLKERGSEGVVCIGLCAGSYQAFHAALSPASGISGVVMLNPLAFHSDRASDSDRPSPLRKALRRVRRVAQRTGRRWFPRAALFAANERRIARSFLELSERGIDVCVVYNENETYLDYLRSALQPVQERLEAGGRFRIRTVGEADHIYSSLAVQAAVTDIVVGYVEELARQQIAKGSSTNVVLQPSLLARP